MGASSLIARLRSSVAKNGPGRTLRLLGPRLYRLAFPVRIPTHPFDLRYGVDTSGLIDADALTSGHAHDSYITAYWGTSPSVLRSLFTHWQQSLTQTPYTLQDYALIDIGSGKGRVVMMASDFPFRSILGVELNPALTAIAKANLAKWTATPHACTGLQVLNADALGIPLPDSPTLLYLYNPFDEHVLQPFLDRLYAASQTRTPPIDLMYVRAEHAHLVESVPGITLLWAGDVPLAPEDTAVDAFQTKQQDAKIYRLPGTAPAGVPAS